MPALMWPSSDASTSTMALPMPVLSSTQPSSTNTGTDTRMMLDMPSSMRLTTTVSGVVVAKPR
jgi:hypothetical protein